VKTIKVILVIGMALFMSFAAFGNLTMPDVGMGAMSVTLGMETTFKHPMAMWRAISSPWIIQLGFGVIVLVELASAVLLWWGAIRMWNARGSAASFNAAKQRALLGLGVAACLYLVGWLAICNEWFEMWQSQKLNVLQDAFRVFAECLLIMIWVNTADEPSQPTR
jgi:predicted small integral membrane protein